jgi:hypothetical protein
MFAQSFVNDFINSSYMHVLRLQCEESVPSGTSRISDTGSAPLLYFAIQHLNRNHFILHDRAGLRNCAISESFKRLNSVVIHTVCMTRWRGTF